MTLLIATETTKALALWQPNTIAVLAALFILLATDCILLH